MLSEPMIYRYEKSSEYDLINILKYDTNVLDHIFIERTHGFGFFGVNTSNIKTMSDMEPLKVFESSVLATNYLSITPKSHNIIYYKINLPKNDYDVVVDRFRNFNNASIKVTYYDQPDSLYNNFSIIIPFLLFMRFLSFIYPPEKTDMMKQLTGDMDIYRIDKIITTRFTDIVGLYEAKIHIQKYVDIMKNRAKYDTIGATIPKGVLLCGPPGCGKTLLAKAVAGEAGVNFLSVCGSDFDEIFVGVGSSRVKQLFDIARASTPVIIFIDEIDSIGEKRNSGMFKSKGSDTLNKILSEMDGFKNRDNIMVLAATNSEQTLDPALLRSGRFDSKIYIDPPNRKERTEMFKLYVSKIKLDMNLVINDLIDKLARMAPGLSGADVANVCNQAAINAVSDDSPVCREMDLMKAIDDVAIGIEKKSRKLEKLELDMTAYHESGHALMSYILKDSMSPMKLSIIPRGHGIAGYTMSQESENGNKTKEQFVADVYQLLAGRGAEIVKFNTISSGAGSDFEKATKIIENMITKHGMYCNYAPMVYCMNRNSPECVSDNKRTDIENSIQSELNHIFNNVLSILEKYKPQLDKLAQKLLEDELVEYSQIKHMFPDIESSISIALDFKQEISESES
jgi:cell division protease FtsH